VEVRGLNGRGRGREGQSGWNEGDEGRNIEDVMGCKGRE
jgi:hypothetical protein